MTSANCHSIFFCLLLSANYSFAKNSPLISSSEEIKFLNKSEQALLDLNKTKKFYGVLTRLNINEPDKSHVDLYEFGVTQKTLDSALCQKLLEDVYGPSKKISLKIISKEFFKNARNEKVCEVTLADNDKQALFKEHHFFAIIMGDKAVGLVSRLNKPATKQEVEEYRKFVKGLHLPQ